MNEQQAITRMKQGDIRGLEVLVHDYQVRAVRTAMMVTQDRAIAEDVVQSTFVRIYHKIHQFEDGRPFGPWFLRSVVNAAVQEMRKRGRHVSLDAEVPWLDSDVTFEDLLPAKDIGPDDSIEATELADTIREALARLSPDQRAAVVLRYFLDMSEREMADELDVPAGTIKWRLHAARKRLRGLLLEQGMEYG